jgi:hypothetical protein
MASAPKLCPKGVVVELKREIMEGKGGKEGEVGRLTTNLQPTSYTWPPLNPYFHPPLYLDRNFYHAHSTDQKYQK